MPPWRQLWCNHNCGLGSSKRNWLLRLFLQGLQEHISFDGSGNLQIEAMEIGLDAWSELNISSSETNISAAQFSIDSPMVDFAGLIQSEVVETKSVISSSYTPGAGNAL